MSSIGAAAALALVIGLGASGCGDIVSSNVDGGPSDAGTGTDANADPCRRETIPIELYRDCLLEAFCASQDCGVEAGGGPAAPFCSDPSAAFVLVDRPLGLVEVGSVTYDPGAAATCVRSVRDSCRAGLGAGPMYLRSDSLCSGVFAGVLSGGQPCFYDEECGSAGQCGGQGTCPMTMQCCEGVCSGSFRPLFARCALGQPCDPGLFCVENPDTGESSCQLGRMGSPCSDDSTCAVDHYCAQGGPATLGTCELDKAQNVQCFSDAECAAPLRCVGDDLSLGQGTCADVSISGESCDRDDNTESIRAAPDCLGQFYCAGTTNGAPQVGACTELPGDSEACDIAADCAAGFYCNSTTCLPRGVSGAACVMTSECADGLVCQEDSKCQAPVEDGSPCSSSPQCASGVCVNTECQALDVCRGT